MRVSAPGKLFLLGEYGVLAGGRALVLAVDRRARGELRPRGGAEGDLIPAVARRLDRSPDGVKIDTSAFRDASGRKLGVGSSAAAAAVAAGLLEPDRTRAFAAAVEGHRDAQGGRGSGLDVASAFFGGLILGGRQPGPIEALPLALPGLRLVVLGTPSAAVTSDFIRRAQAAAGWASFASTLAEVAEEGASAWRRARSDELLRAVRAHAIELDRFGREAGVPILDDVSRRAIAAAERLGGAAKPSGAGGGDVMIAFLPEDAAGDLGLERLAVSADPIGIAYSA